MPYNGDGSREYQDIQSLKSDMGALENEFKKLNQFWVDRYNELKQMVSVAIGVRNNKIKELNGRINKCEFTIENELNPRYIDQTNRIETLEKQLKNLEHKLKVKIDQDRIYGGGHLDKRITALAEQVDLNSQTLEELK